MLAQSDDNDPFAPLAAAVVRRYGTAARIENFRIPTLGGSNRTIVFDLVEGASRRKLVSRQATYVASNNPFIPTSVQFRVMRTAWRHHIPVPEPVFEYDEADGMGEGFVSAFVTGETRPTRIQAMLRESGGGDALAAQLGTLMGKLHCMPTEDFALLEQVDDSRNALKAQLDRYDSYGEIRPAIEFGLRWLERNAPPARTRSFVHGDFRLGNFMVQEGEITALLDWECAHLGDPTEDIGWLCTRSWRFGRPDLELAGVSHPAPFLDAYRAVTGVRPDADELRYWQIFGLVRWAILNIMQAEAHVRGERIGVVFAACGRNTALVEYDLMMTLAGRYP